MLLPNAQVTRAVIQRYARLRARYRKELGVRPLVLPDASFFPDVFTPDAPSLELITRRMQAHAGLNDIPILPVIGVLPEGSTTQAASSCSSGACSVPSSVTSGAPRLFDDGDGWQILVPEVELRHPVALTTNLARSMAFIFLVETQREGESLEPPLDVTADMIATSLGFGPLLLEGSHIYAKGCGGPQIASVTTMTVGELAIATALFAAVGGHPLAPALKALGVTQRAVLREAGDLIAANRELIVCLQKEPSLVASTPFELESPGTFLTNWLKKRRARAPQPQLPANTKSTDADEVDSLRLSMPPSSRAGRPITSPGLLRRGTEDEQDVLSA